MDKSVGPRDLMYSGERPSLPYREAKDPTTIRCTRIRVDGERCHMYSVRSTHHLPYPVCRFHLKGAASRIRYDPARRHIVEQTIRYGRYSSHLPSDLLANYERALRDPNLVALRDELALLDSRMQAMLAALTAGSTNALWDSLSGLADRAVTAADALTTAPTDDAKNRATKALADSAYALAQLCATAASTSSTWSEMYDLLDLRRRLTETEQKRLVNLNTVLSSDKALALVTALAGSIRKHVTDPAALVAISADFSVILNASVDNAHNARNAHAAAIPAAVDPTIPQRAIDSFYDELDTWDEDSGDPPPMPPATRRVGRARLEKVAAVLPHPLATGDD